MARQSAATIVLALAIASCGSADSEGGLPDVIEAAENGEALAEGQPEGCHETPYAIDLEFEGVDDFETAEFRVVTAIAKPTPIVPDPEQELGPDDLEQTKQRAADTDLVLYTLWLGDFEFTADDIGLLSGPTPPEGGTVLALTIVPPSELGLTAGEVVRADQEIQYDTFTTFATVGTFLDTARNEDLTIATTAPFAGRVEVLALDAEQICVAWDDSGVVFDPEGTWRVSGVVMAEVAPRGELPFT